MVVCRSRCRTGPIGIRFDHGYNRAALTYRFDMAPPVNTDHGARVCDIICVLVFSIDNNVII
jgi:hypothetical protein